MKRRRPHNIVAEVIVHRCFSSQRHEQLQQNIFAADVALELDGSSRLNS